MSSEQIPQLLVAIVVLAVAWVVLQFVLHLAAKVFACGCSVLLLLGAAILAWSYFGGGG